MPPRSTTTRSTTATRARKTAAPAALAVKPRTVTVPATKKPTIRTLPDGVTVQIVRERPSSKSVTFRQVDQIGATKVIQVVYITNDGLAEMAEAAGVDVDRVAGFEVTFRPIIAG